MKRQPIEWEEIFTNHVSDKGLISRIHKEPLQLNTNKTTRLRNEERMNRTGVYPHNGILSSNKRKEILTPATTRMNLEAIVLSEISQTQKGKSYMIPLPWN